MRNVLSVALIFFPWLIQSLEHELQFENDDVRVSRVVLGGKEEVGLHRDEHPHVVIALRGGSVMRLEQDGSTNEVHFPTRGVVFREVDPVGQLHSTVNLSDNPIEIIVVELKHKE